MFKNLIRELDILSKTDSVSISINTDEKGFLDKECPNEECLFKFKIFEADWNEKVSDEVVFCPKCGHKANSDCWWTSEHLEDAKELAIRQITGRIRTAIKRDAQELNRSQSRNSFIKMRMDVKGNSNTYLFPIPALEEMEQEIQCTECKTRYSVIGSAFFCPCCGHNSAEVTFNNTINNIGNSIKNLHIIREAVSRVNKDEAENTCRSLIEKGLLDCVVAFQRFCEVTYKKHAKANVKIPINAFQRLDVGGKIWKELIGQTYSDWLTETEYSRLNTLFHRRHLLQHTEAIVDNKYLERTNDKTYQVNQRIVVNVKDVLELVDYVKSLKMKISNCL